MLAITKVNQIISLKKQYKVYALISLLTFIVSKIYGVFGHGVTSPFMTWMFLWPLLGGALVYYIIEKSRPSLVKTSYFRVFSNLYNAGIATLTAGSFLQGIIEIAGASSDYIPYIYLMGGTFIIAGCGMLMIQIGRKLKRRN